MLKRGFNIYKADKLIKMWLEKSELKKKIHEWLRNAEPFGFNSESMSEAIMGCLKNQTSLSKSHTRSHVNRKVSERSCI